MRDIVPTMIAAALLVTLGGCVGYGPGEADDIGPGYGDAPMFGSPFDAWGGDLGLGGFGGFGGFGDGDGDGDGD